MNHVPTTWTLLQDRENEVNGYLTFLKVAVERDASVSARDGELHLGLSLQLTHTLKANLVLLLYSAMEASLIQLLDEMHDAISSKCDSTDRLNTELLRLVLRTVKRDSKENVLTSESPLHKSLFKYWIGDWKNRASSKEKRVNGISGSVDGLVFYQQLKQFGVIPQTPNDKPPSHLTHYALQRVKVKRNELAHGEKSFIDLGRELPMEELEEDAGVVFLTLKNIASEVNTYLKEMRFFATTDAADFDSLATAGNAA
jgi:MAE_28990/MAE_18760-like HEPN